MIETQNTVAEWMYRTFPGTDPMSPRKCLRALEEMAELCLAAGATPADLMTAIGTAWGNHTGFLDQSVPNLPKVSEEAADVVIVLYGVAQMKGFDLHAEIDKKMTVNRARKWAVRGDGTGYHVKPDEPPC